MVFQSLGGGGPSTAPLGTVFKSQVLTQDRSPQGHSRSGGNALISSTSDPATGLFSHGSTRTALPSSSSYPYVVQEAATISQLDGKSTLIYSALYVNFTLHPGLSGVATVYALSGFTSTYDWYIVGVGYNLNLISYYSGKGCVAGFQELLLVTNQLGNTVAAACETKVAFAAGDSVTLGLNWSSTSPNNMGLDACNQKSCGNYYVSQPDTGANGLSVMSTARDVYGGFTGTMTWLMDPTASGCKAYTGVPQVDYYYHYGVYTTQYIPWSQSWDSFSNSYCYNPATSVLTLAPSSAPTVYTEATGGSTDGPHWVAGQNVSLQSALSASYWWRFQTDVSPLSTPTLSASRATADSGQSVNFTAATTGGLPPYTYPWFLNSVAQGSTASPWQWIASASPGSYSTYAYVVDSDYDEYGPSSTVVVSVTADPSVTVPTASPPSGGIDLGQKVLFTSATPTGGLAPFSYAWTSLPAGCVNSGASNVSCTPSASGTFNVIVKVTDKNVYTVVSPALSYTVEGALAATLATNKSVVDLGQSVDLTSTPTGGAGPYSYSYGGLPSGCLNANTASLLCKPNSSGVFKNVTVSITDANKATVVSSPAITITVNPKLVIGTFTANPTSVPDGGTSFLNVTASGGTAPLTYAYSGLPPGCTSSNVASLPCKPTTSGVYNITVVVSDAQGMAVSSIAKLTVVGPRITGFTVTPTTVTVGQSASFSVTATGGATPYTYAYTGLPPGCTSSNAATLPCTPTSIGVFNVSVLVTDAQGGTATSSTQLAVKPGNPSITSFTVSPATVNVGQTATFSVTVTGGVSPYTYSYSGLPTGCTTMNKSTLPCSPSSSGSFTVTVSVIDSVGKSATPQTSTLKVNPSQSSGPTISAFTASPNPVTVGNPVAFAVTVTGGTTPYTYSYAGLPNGCMSSSTANLTCSPATSGTFNVSVSVIDSKSMQASNYVILTVQQVAGGPTVSSIVATPNPVNVGQSLKITVAASGGATPYSYAYSGLPPGCLSANANPLTCTPSSPGNYTISVLVTDSSGKSAAKSTLLVVTGAILPLSVKLSSNLSSIAAGSSVTLTASVIGGVGPFVYVWSLNGTNVTSGPNSATWSDTIAHIGTYDFTVWVRDAKGNVAESPKAEVIVNGATMQSTPQTFPWWILLLVIAAVAIAMLLYVRERRRKTARATAQSVQAGEGEMAGMGLAPEAMAAGAIFEPQPTVEPQTESMVEPSQTPEVPLFLPVSASVVEEGAIGMPESEAPSVDNDVTPATEATLVEEPTQEVAAVAPTEEMPDTGTTGPVPIEMPADTLPPPPEPVADGTETSLTECPQCMGPLTPELYCLVCSVSWVRDDLAPSASSGPETGALSTLPEGVEPLTECPQCHGQLSGDMSCGQCNVVWTPPENTPDGPETMDVAAERAAQTPTSVPEVTEGPPVENHGAAEIEAELYEAVRRRKEVAQGPADISQPPSGEMKDMPSSSSQSSAPTIPKPQGKACFMCGGELEDGYCRVCDMHWESGGPS